MEKYSHYLFTKKITKSSYLKRAMESLFTFFKMADFFKGTKRDEALAKRLKRHKQLDFKTLVEAETGEVKKETAEYNGLTFNIFPSNSIQISGSLHKYANEGFHNYDDFTTTRILHAVRDFELRFGISAEHLHLHNIEFGVNIQLDNLSPLSVINKVIGHNYLVPERNAFKDVGKGKGTQLHWEHDNYLFKVYDKQRQHNLPDNILRLELRVKAMKHLGVIKPVLADVTRTDFLKQLSEELIKTYDGLLIGEEINMSELKPKEKQLFIDGTNPHYWMGKIKDRRKRYIKRKKFEHILENYGSGIKKNIDQLIRTKIQYLLEN